jgi:hypothetical protein
MTEQERLACTDPTPMPEFLAGMLKTSNPGLFMYDAKNEQGMQSVRPDKPRANNTTMLMVLAQSVSRKCHGVGNAFPCS